MTTTPSPLTSLRHAITSAETDPYTIATAAAGNANSNASHNTYLTLTTTESLHRAEQLPNLFADVQNRPPLYGIPISLKDCFDLAGTVTSCGSRYYQQLHPIAAKNSWVAQRLLDAGAIIPGKTHLNQLAYGITGENADYGDSLQPRDSTLLTGGSSSGAAASVQEGSALAAIGTDTGGSVRVPSALCGLAGYRASHGVSRGEERWFGAAHLAPSFDTLGLLFRDLRDGPALASAIYDIPSAPVPTQLRIGYVNDEFMQDCEPEVHSAFAAWKQHLRQHGATLTPINTAFWADSLEIFTSIQASEAAQLHRGHYQHFEPAIAERLTWGASITADQLQSLHHRLEVFRTQMSSLFQQADLLLVPFAPVSRLFAGKDQSHIRKAILRYTTPVSLAGLPAVTLAGEAINAPFGTGMQLIAAPMQDAALLAFAASLPIRHH
ncbi:amidase family protein [Tunturiibacter empetritectus]|uniref:Aspartyl-tRNA(Asn)/glutamyl-tRNA(Gln) amidotransferase subunit A n=1 Tax=Tunturiibacter lichenicola TaxID=2051959 RepID=A0A852VNQ7_9BACT|nr:amidase family protein [Edaphobacter lichenicola]NYF91695.1 aspartyl-tRNA(Asn)/glutamyl-tRNA(Gln) amidotransferase subunit A [Edaphobacter lichenicola]